MNKLWFFFLICCCGCISKSDFKDPTIAEYRLSKIDLYTDSTLEILGTVYPSEKYDFVIQSHRDENFNSLYLKKNGEVIWEIATEHSGLEYLEFQNLPLEIQTSEGVRLLWERTIENDTFIFLFVEDRMYLIDRSNVLGALWSDPDGQQYNGVELINRNVYFCFEKMQSN
jgi:hypothetical protein